MLPTMDIGITKSKSLFSLTLHTTCTRRRAIFGVWRWLCAGIWLCLKRKGEHKHLALNAVRDDKAFVDHYGHVFSKKVCQSWPHKKFFVTYQPLVEWRNKNPDQTFHCAVRLVYGQHLTLEDRRRRCLAFQLGMPENLWSHHGGELEFPLHQSRYKKNPRKCTNNWSMKKLYGLQ